MANDFENELQHVPDVDEQPPIPDDIPAGRIIRPELLDLEDDIEKDPSIYTREVKRDDGPALVGPSFVSALSKDEAAELGLDDGAWEQVDPHGDAIADTEKKLRAGKADQTAETLAMFDEAIASEDKRVAELDQKLADDDTRKMLLGEDEAGAYAKLHPELDEERYVERTRIASEGPSPDELVPSYDYEDEEEPPEALPKKPEEERPAPGATVEYATYVKELTVTDLSYGDDIATVVKEKEDSVTTISSNRKKVRVMGDQAFDNSINKFKKDNFRVVKVPLVNSGFMASLVGTGAIDLTLLYDQTNERTDEIEYELEKMRIIIRSVVGTEPKIDKNDLRNMIHYVDYNLMAYAHMVATLATVEMIHTCKECGRDFRIQANSGDLLLNYKELAARMHQIQAAGKPDLISLMARDRKLDTYDGFSITLGHPSYAEYIQYLSEMKALTEQVNKGMIVRIAQLSEVLAFVRGIKLPNGTVANNLYQRFRAVTMLSGESYDLMESEIKAMIKQIVYPKFGIRKVQCPHCGKNNTDITYTGLNELLFFHTMVNRLMKLTDQ